MTEKRYYAHKHLLQENKVHDKICHNFMNIDETVEHMNNQYWKYKHLKEENEQLKNKIDVLEDDNETYHKSLEKLNLYTKRFIPTKCTNEFKDCKTNRYYWLDHEGNFEGCLELLNLLDCENEVLKSENRQLKGRLMEYEEQIKGDVE
jgi:cell shape-determining protein MreC